MYLLLLRSLFLPTISSYCLVSFHFTLHYSLIFCRAGLVVTNSLSFCLLGNVLILKDRFARLYDSWLTGFCFLFFSFSILNILVYCLLASKVAYNFYGGSLVCDKLLLSWCSQNSPFVFVFWKFGYNVSWCESLSSCYLEFFLNDHINVFNKICDVLSNMGQYDIKVQLCDKGVVWQGFKMWYLSWTLKEK